MYMCPKVVVVVVVVVVVFKLQKLQMLEDIFIIYVKEKFRWFLFNWYES